MLNIVLFNYHGKLVLKQVAIIQFGLLEQLSDTSTELITNETYIITT